VVVPTVGKQFHTKYCII